MKALIQELVFFLEQPISTNAVIMVINVYLNLILLNISKILTQIIYRYCPPGQK